MLVFHSVIIFACFCFDLTEHIPIPEMHLQKAHRQMAYGGYKDASLNQPFVHTEMYLHIKF